MFIGRVSFVSFFTNSRTNDFYFQTTSDIEGRDWTTNMFSDRA